MLKLIQNKKKGGEKAFRYSLRKFKFGAASVLVGLAFLGLGSQKVYAHYIADDNIIYLGDSKSEANAARQTMKIRTEISRGGTHVKYTIIFNDNYELWRRPGLNVWLPEGLREETITIKTFTSAGVTGGGGKEFRLKNDLNLTNFKSPTRELLKPPHRGGNKANWDKFWTNVTSTGSGSEIATKWKDQNLLSFGLNSWENRSHNAYKWEIEADAKNGVVLSQLPILAGMENWDNGYPRYVLSGPDETADTDGDGFPDKVEKAEGTDPNDPKSNPDTKDTDGDGFPDKVEKAEGTDPNDPKSNPDTKDTDGDSFPDVVEKDAGSDPNDKNSTPDNVDTDKDGFPDVVEKDAGTDPNDPKLE
ncbi:YSIRK-type signal peptide-containing protein, partial [Streptococcus pseudopneumoniae]